MNGGEPSESCAAIFFSRFSCERVTRDGLIERGTTLIPCGLRYAVIHGVCHIVVS